MFEMIYSGCAYDSLHCVSLRCECGNEMFVDTDNFQEVTKTYVILKNNLKVTCSKCGKSQPRNERFIPQEPQVIRHTYAPKKGLFTRFIEGMANMTPEETLNVSNTIASYNTDFPSSSD